MQYGVQLFDNVGAINAQLTPQQLEPVWDEIKEIQSDWSTASPANKVLAGNIEHEYNLTKCHKHVEELLLPLVYEYDQKFKLLDDFHITRTQPDIALASLWVNFQKKHEFNPLHYHDGLLSFVIWMDSPFDIRDEMSRPSSLKSNANIPGHFSLTYINSVGKLGIVNLPVDRSWNGRMLLFQSKMHHCVCLLYTSPSPRDS